MFVHFPVALIVTAAMCLTAARWISPPARAAAIATVGSWNLGIGAISVLVALGTGLAAVIDLHVGPSAHQAIAAHVKSAILTTLLIMLAALWRGFGVASDSRPTVGFLVVLWLATASMTVTGYRGGLNVYRHGIGVSESSGTVQGT
jgi:uncharacterized membrane protein